MRKPVRANAWMFNQVLATGVHGVMLTHADDPGAIRAFVEAVRFPIHHAGCRVRRSSMKDAAVFTGLRQRPRSGEFLRRNTRTKRTSGLSTPNGELLLGVKEEDKYALANVEENLKVPGIGLAEWGPGDMAMSLGVRAQARQRSRIREWKRHGPRSSLPVRQTTSSS